MKRTIQSAMALGLVGVIGCGEGQPPREVPETYAFQSRDAALGQSVAYSGQTLRHVLIEDLKAQIGGLTARIDNGTQAPTPEAGAVLAELDFYYRLDTSGAEVKPLLTTTPALMQTTYSQIGSGNLTSKIAGKDDPEKQHKSWTTQFQGWTGASSPEGLVTSWFELLDARALDRANGIVDHDPVTGAVLPVHLTADGLELRELLQKFLVGAVAFSQGADDYLDEGLEADHSALEAGKPYTALEHAWDEGFGYFGAARNYLTLEDSAVAAKPYGDVDGDGKIDVKSEYSFGHSTNASKRDAGSAATARTNFSEDAMKGFLAGRALLASTTGPLTAAEKTELAGYRDQAVSAWEKAIAASVVHYINDVVADMGKFGTAEYKFSDHAKHWGEMKGFALSLQFNPRSPLTAAKFAELHSLLGDRPVLPNAAGAEEYRVALIQARAVLHQAYAFHADNVNDW